MAREEFDPFDNEPISTELELAVLRFWAAAMQMERSFSRQEIEAIPGLSLAIEAAQSLPAAIGWDDVVSDYALEHT